MNLHHPEARLATAVICRMWERRQRGICPAVPPKVSPRALPAPAAGLAAMGNHCSKASDFQTRWLAG